MFESGLLFLERTAHSLPPRAEGEGWSSAPHPAGQPDWGSGHRGSVLGSVKWGQQKGPGFGKAFGRLQVQAGRVEVGVAAFSKNSFFRRHLHL